jgi:hypothetical protein
MLLPGPTLTQKDILSLSSISWYGYFVQYITDSGQTSRIGAVEGEVVSGYVSSADYSSTSDDSTKDILSDISSLDDERLPTGDMYDSNGNWLYLAPFGPIEV